MLIAFSAPETGLVHTVRYYSPKVTAAFRTIIIVVQCVCVCVHCDTHSICCITCMQMCTYTHTHTVNQNVHIIIYSRVICSSIYRTSRLNWNKKYSSTRSQTLDVLFVGNSEALWNVVCVCVNACVYFSGCVVTPRSRWSRGICTHLRRTTRNSRARSSSSSTQLQSTQIINRAPQQTHSTHGRLYLLLAISTSMAIKQN